MDILATALPALSEAFGLILTPTSIGYLVLGVVLGLSVGVFPGLGGIAGLSLVLPFIYGMDPVAGLSMMVGLVAVIPTSDTFASVLLGIPGSSASQATVLDGFPMSRRGQAARALAAAFASSLFGGLFGAVILTFFILIARPLILAFGLPELLMLTVLGLSMVGVLAGRSLLKGLIAAALGLAVGAIGEAPAMGTPRMSFGSWYMQDGLALVIVGLGIFAIPEIISLLRRDRAISDDAKLGAGWVDGLRDWWINRWLSLRCAVIGVIIGVVPGLGGSVVDWIAYGHAVQTTRDKSQFGKGEVRGIIGPESSNNAKEGGGLVPTLLFGIPGSGSMAVFIGGMILLGYEAGPQMISNDLPITYTVVWSLALANVVGAGLCIFLSPAIARMTTIRFALLAPFLFLMISFAAFQSKQTLWDLGALVAIGILGIFMRRFEWPRPAFLIGFVLASQAESYTFQATQVAGSRFRQGMEEGMAYLFSPTVIVLIVITVVSVWLGMRQAKGLHDQEAAPETGSKRAPLAFALVITAFFAVMFVNSLLIGPLQDKIFPSVISGLALVGCAVLLLQMRLRPETDPLFVDGETRGEDAEAPKGLWPTMGWFVALLALTALFGFVIALAVYFLAFLLIRARAGMGQTALLTALGVGGILFIAFMLNRDFRPDCCRRWSRCPGLWATDDPGARDRAAARPHPPTRRAAALSRAPGWGSGAMPMTQIAIPFLFLRGGTSRGPYFRRSDLPEDRETLADHLISCLGAGHPQNIDGIGGGVATTTKVAMLSRSDDPGADVDYFFAQVAVDKREVDFKPTCGNILSGVGPAAIEMGLVAASDPETRVRILGVNTGARVEAIVQTPGGVVRYDGDAAIDGVPGTAAPIRLNFMDVVGGATGAMFPTGQPLDVIQGVEVTCIDVAMPLVIARAEDMGLTGYETRDEIEANREFYARMEPLRIAAGERMGFKNLTESVVPKFAVLAPPRAGGMVATRYFMPWSCHPSMAVTGAQAIASCCLAPGTVAAPLGLARPAPGAEAVLEHPSGQIEVTVDYTMGEGGFTLHSAGILRTARKLAEGSVFVPAR